VTGTSTLSPEAVLAFAEQVATSVVSDDRRFRKDVTFTRVEGDETSSHFLATNPALGLNRPIIGFEFHVAPEGAGTRFTTQLTTYRTVQSTFFGFIPIGQKGIEAFYFYEKFMRDFLAKLPTADPQATASIEKGEEV